MFLLNSTSDGASVLACASQLKVWSQEPKDFEHWFFQRLWKIRNVFIKQHQRGRWRYLFLLAQSIDTLSSLCPISLKNTSKTHRTYLLFMARVRKRAPMMAHASQRVPYFTKKHFKNSPHFIYF